VETGSVALCLTGDLREGGSPGWNGSEESFHGTDVVIGGLRKMMNRERDLTLGVGRRGRVKMARNSVVHSVPVCKHWLPLRTRAGRDLREMG